MVEFVHSYFIDGKLTAIPEPPGPTMENDKFPYPDAIPPPPWPFHPDSHAVYHSPYGSPTHLAPSAPRQPETTTSYGSRLPLAYESSLPLPTPESHAAYHSPNAPLTKIASAVPRQQETITSYESRLPLAYESSLLPPTSTAYGSQLPSAYQSRPPTPPPMMWFRNTPAAAVRVGDPIPPHLFGQRVTDFDRKQVPEDIFYYNPRIKYTASMSRIPEHGYVPRDVGGASMACKYGPQEDVPPLVQQHPGVSDQSYWNLPAPVQQYSEGAGRRGWNLPAPVQHYPEASGSRDWNHLAPVPSNGLLFQESSPYAVGVAATRDRLDSLALDPHGSKTASKSAMPAYGFNFRQNTATVVIPSAQAGAAIPEPHPNAETEVEHRAFEFPVADDQSPPTSRKRKSQVPGFVPTPFDAYSPEALWFSPVGAPKRQRKTTSQEKHGWELGQGYEHADESQNATNEQSEDGGSVSMGKRSPKLSCTKELQWH